MMKTFGGWFRTLRNIQSDAENGYYIIGSYQIYWFLSPTIPPAEIGLVVLSKTLTVFGVEYALS